MGVLGPKAQKTKSSFFQSGVLFVLTKWTSIQTKDDFSTLFGRNWRHRGIKRPPHPIPKPTAHWMYNEFKSNYKCSLPQTNSTLASKMQMCGIFCCDESLCAGSEAASHVSVAAAALFPLSQPCQRERGEERKWRLVILQQNRIPESF